MRSRRQTGPLSLEPRGPLRHHDVPELTANGFCQDRERSRMYIARTRDRVIDVYDFDAERGTPGACRRLGEVSEADGKPGGAAIDADGC